MGVRRRVRPVFCHANRRVEAKYRFYIAGPLEERKADC